MSNFTRSSSAVLISGMALTEEKTVTGTVTEMKPGRLVKKGADDEKVVINTAGGDFVGVLGYEHSPSQFTPANLTTAYAANDAATILKGSIVVGGELADVGGITKGASLYGAADGKVSATVVGRVVAIAEESRSNAGPIAMRMVS